LWLVPLAIGEPAEHNKKRRFLLIKISTVIRLIFYTASGAVVTMLFGASVVGTSSYADAYIIISLSALMLFSAAVTIFTGYYFLSLIRFIKCVEFSLIKNRYIKTNVKYNIYFNCIIAIFLLISAPFLSTALLISNISNALFLFTISVYMKKLSSELYPKLKKPTEKKEDERHAPRSVKIKTEQKPYIPKEPEQISFAIPNKSKKYCIKCGEMIAEDANTCPFCHTDQDHTGQQHFKI